MKNMSIYLGAGALALAFAAISPDLGLFTSSSAQAQGVKATSGGAEPAKATDKALVKGKEMTVTTSDGVVIHGLYGAGQAGKGGVVFLPMLGRTHSDYAALQGQFQAAGFHTLSIDLRGHGASTKVEGQEEAVSFERFRAEDFNKMPQDVKAAVAWLKVQPGVGRDISLVGASIGANVALIYGASDPKISRVALLSPGLEYKGVAAEDALMSYGKRPLFMAVSREDSYAGKSVLVFDAMSPSETKEVKIFTGAGHGTRMFEREPTLAKDLVNWISGVSPEVPEVPETP